MQYDVFISYRRVGGEESAKIIYDQLTRLGYTVFFDVETIRSGPFNTLLYKVIEDCRDVLVVLGPDSLDRCSNEGDWVRLEIAHALKCGKNVIPVMLRGFSFPDSLPEDIDALRFHNGLEASIEFFDAFIRKLCTFMQSKPALSKRLLSGAFLKRWITIPATIALLIATLWFGSKIIYQNSDTASATYPHTQAEKNDVKEMFSYVSQNLSVLDNICSEYIEAFDMVKKYIQDNSAVSFTTVTDMCVNAANKIERYTKSPVQLPSDLRENLRKTQVNMADLSALSTYPGLLGESLSNDLTMIYFLASPDAVVLNKENRLKIVDIYESMYENETDRIYTGLCDLLQPIDESVVADFRTTALSQCLHINAGRQWLYKPEDIKQQTETIENIDEKLLNDFSFCVGQANTTALADPNEFVQSAIQGGMTRDEAEAMVNGFMDNILAYGNLKESVEELQKELEAEKQKAKEKFKPLDTDEPGIIWSKALRFMTLKMYDEAESAFQLYLIKIQDSDPDAKQYVPSAIQFVRQIRLTGIDYGAIITTYEPGKDPHSVYKIGDIVIAYNNNPVQTVDDYFAFRTQSGKEDYTVTLLRPDAEGNLVMQNVEIKYGEPKVALMSLGEVLE